MVLIELKKVSKSYLTEGGEVRANQLGLKTGAKLSLMTAHWKSFRSGAEYPASWEIDLPHHDLRLELIPLAADQELMTPKSTGVTYWEGAVKVKGHYKGRAVEGNGYVEMTGYDRRFKPKI